MLNEGLLIRPRNVGYFPKNVLGEAGNYERMALSSEFKRRDGGES